MEFRLGIFERDGNCYKYFVEKTKYNGTDDEEVSFIMDALLVKYAELEIAYIEPVSEKPPFGFLECKIWQIFAKDVYFKSTKSFIYH